MEQTSMPTVKDVKDVLQGTSERKPEGKISVSALQNILIGLSSHPNDSYNEVYPSIILGDCKYAKDPETLTKLGVTHVVNCACGKKFNQIDTDEQFFQESGITFHGIAATNMVMYKMTRHFDAAVDFMHDALQSGGKLYVHCRSGESRSATIVLAYLIAKQNIGLMDAVKLVQAKRKILPNDGFISELVTLNNTIHGHPTSELH